MEEMKENINETEDQLIVEVEGETPQGESETTFDYNSLTDEEKERFDEINEVIKADKLDPTTAINILINAVQVSYDKDHFNDLDRFLIAKSLGCLKSYADSGEDITIKVS